MVTTLARQDPTARTGSAGPAGMRRGLADLIVVFRGPTVLFEKGIHLSLGPRLDGVINVIVELPLYALYHKPHVRPECLGSSHLHRFSPKRCLTKQRPSVW